MVVPIRREKKTCFVCVCLLFPLEWLPLKCSIKGPKEVSRIPFDSGFAAHSRSAGVGN